MTDTETKGREGAERSADLATPALPDPPDVECPCGCKRTFLAGRQRIYYCGQCRVRMYRKRKLERLMGRIREVLEDEL